MNGLDDLDAEVAKKKRAPNRRGEITPPPRHPKPTEPADQKEQAYPEAGTPVSGHAGVPVHAHTDPPAPQAAPEPVRSQEASSKRTRPPSVEAYLTDDLADWMWKVRAAGMAQRKDNIASAVVRLALEELRASRTPKQIIDALDQVPDPAPTRGRRGRRR
ncbi:hypothetical protein [Nocardiopsis tropica]|uniref:Uncharacterized protein n=1 Tax=Nocardiopsis tropica TaxID=109330 RepID=A0ABV2A5Z9_9ACTN